MSAPEFRLRLVAIGFVAAASCCGLVLRRAPEAGGWLWVEPMFHGRWAVRGDGVRPVYGLTADEAWERVGRAVG